MAGFVSDRHRGVLAIAGGLFGYDGGGISGALLHVKKGLRAGQFALGETQVLPRPPGRQA